MVCLLDKVVQSFQLMSHWWLKGHKAKMVSRKYFGHIVVTFISLHQINAEILKLLNTFDSINSYTDRNHTLVSCLPAYCSICEESLTAFSSKQIFSFHYQTRCITLFFSFIISSRQFILYFRWGIIISLTLWTLFTVNQTIDHLKIQILNEWSGK